MNEPEPLSIVTPSIVTPIVRYGNGENMGYKFVDNEIYDSTGALVVPGDCAGWVAICATIKKLVFPELSKKHALLKISTEPFFGPSPVHNIKLEVYGKILIPESLPDTITLGIVQTHIQMHFWQAHHMEVFVSVL